MTRIAAAPVPDPAKARERWSTFGPYYAMFPVSFALDVIRKHTQPGEGVVDPFAGRGTTIYCAEWEGRTGIGAEINPLGWTFGVTKLAPASRHNVERRYQEIDLLARAPEIRDEMDGLPPFFAMCFGPRTLPFLVAARRHLDWKGSRVDRTAMAFLLVHLHGKVEKGRPNALSNQMRQAKAMAPDYSMRWWKNNGFATPPDVDPVAFMRDRLEWRYRHGTPASAGSRVLLGDCRTALRGRPQAERGRATLLLTSPPYRGVTSYYYDQWLRFWLMGDTAHPTVEGDSWRGKFRSQQAYDELLVGAFAATMPMLAPEATVYVRTDARLPTLDATVAALRHVFPDKRMRIEPAPFIKATQTSLFGDREQKPGEMDVILTA